VARLCQALYSVGSVPPMITLPPRISNTSSAVRLASAAGSWVMFRSCRMREGRLGCP